MKTLIYLRRHLLAVLILATSCFDAQLTISINNLSGTNVLTCYTPSIQLMGTSSYTAAPVIYLWNLPSGGFVNNASYNVIQPGTYTLTATAGTLTASQVISISSNTVAPVSAITPTSQTMNCTLSAQPVSLTAVSPTAGVTHSIISPYGSVFYTNPAVAYVPIGGPGTYTYVLTDNSNGCTTIKTFTIAGGSSFPNFVLVSSPPNFTLGCNTKSVIAVTVPGATTNPVAGGAVSYTMLGPSASSYPASGPLLGAGSFTINSPGNYTVVVRDNFSLCDNKAIFKVAQNNTAPGIFVAGTSLSCASPSGTLMANSSSTNAQFSWSVSTAPGSLAGNSVVVTTNSALPATNSIAAIYTATAIDINNLCKSSTIIPVYQNLYKPNAFILSSGQAVSCSQPSVVLTNGSSSSIPPGIFPVTQAVVASSWVGPSPVPSLALSSTFTAIVPGVYTLNVTDQNNGCTSQTTTIIGDNRIYPVFSPGTPILWCLFTTSTTAIISPSIASSTASLSYAWSAPSGATITGSNTAALTTNTTGVYGFTVTDNSTGCWSGTQYTVVSCVISSIAKTFDDQVQVTVFPNPGKDIFLLQGLGAYPAHIHIYDPLGKLIKVQSADLEHNTIELTGEASGIYFIDILQNGKTQRLKLIKE
jgi:hypothetical protein